MFIERALLTSQPDVGSVCSYFDTYKFNLFSFFFLDVSFFFSFYYLFSLACVRLAGLEWNCCIVVWRLPPPPKKYPGQMNPASYAGYFQFRVKMWIRQFPTSLSPSLPRSLVSPSDGHCQKSWTFRARD